MPARASQWRTSERIAVSLTWERVMAWRLQRHELLRRVPRASMLDVVADICGLHAQLMSSTQLSLWARVEDLEPEAVERALWKERSLFKTWAMRGTLHVLPTAEFPLWQAALSTYRHYLQGAWLRHYGVSRDELEQMIAATGQALDGRMLTREELAEEVSKRTGSAELGGKLRESWGVMLKPASFRGKLCFAPSVGQNVRFTRPDRWLGQRGDVAPSDAVLEVTRRYLGAYGPATREDFARWWGLTPAKAMTVIQNLGEEVSQVEIEGARGWMRAAHVAEAAEASPPGSVRLLPAFDPWIVGASRGVPSLLAAERFRDRIYRPQGWISPVLLVDGRMDGIWRHREKGSRLEVRIEPFGNMQPWVRRAAEEEAGRLARFMGTSLELSWGSLND
jgi:Winged helix DNA-binding domain